jgi:hypothetical protein
MAVGPAQNAKGAIQPGLGRWRRDRSPRAAAPGVAIGLGRNTFFFLTSCRSDLAKKKDRELLIDTVLVSFHQAASAGQLLGRERWLGRGRCGLVAAWDGQRSAAGTLGRGKTGGSELLDLPENASIRSCTTICQPQDARNKTDPI